MNMRLNRVVLLALLAYGTLASAVVPKLPASDFARAPDLRQATLSPNGKHLAVVLAEHQTAGVDATEQLVVFDLPTLQVASRLNFALDRLPGQITWVSDTRLVVAEARQTGTLDQPSLDGNIIALDYDGRHQRTLYSLVGRGNLGSSFNMMSMEQGSPNLDGPTLAMDGHVFLSITPFPHNEGTRNQEARRTLLYDVNTMDGYPKQVAEINRGGMQFLVDHDVALYAYGTNDKLEPVVFSRTNGQAQWQRMPVAATGKVFIPGQVTAGGKHVYALYSAEDGPLQLIEASLDGSDRHVLASNSFGSVNTGSELGAVSDGYGSILRLWSTPRSHVPFAVTFSGVYANGKPAIIYLQNDRYAQILKALNKQFGDHLVTFAGISRDGSTILVHAMSGQDPGEYALLDTTSMQLKPLFQSEPWIKPDQIGRRTAFQYHNRSGTLLDGYLTLPAGVPSKGLPTVVMVHGGPIGIRDQWYYDPLQIAPFLANRGYAVLNVNYRGSSGRGMGFQDAGYRQFGTGIQDDIIDAVHWAIRKGYVDPQRICVFGGSFGGYSALMQPILAPDLYKCAIDYAGVSDYTIEFDRSDTSHSKLGNNYFAMAVGTRADGKAISPLYMLSRFNVPVLIAQGGSDPRVPPQNAERLRDALEAAHKPYEWLFFDKEPHGFTTEPHRLALLQRMEMFLTKYLGPGVTATGASQP